MVVEELLRPHLLHPDVQSTVQLKAQLQQYRAVSRTAKQWVDCLGQPIFIMLLFLRAEPEGQLYLKSMSHLHPALLKRFMAGEQVMHHTDGLWNGIWSDLFIESTYMRYGHCPSGIIGATLSKTTLAILALSHNTMGHMSNDVAELDNNQDHVVMRYKEERPA